MTETAHAIRIAAAGGPEVLAWTEVDVPEPGAGQALVRVATAGVNLIDTYHRTGLYPMEFPFTPGVEGAGTVERTAGDVDVAPGDRVTWIMTLGSYAEYAVVDADRLVRIPDGVPTDVAAAVMLQGMTAHYLAHDTFTLAEGISCLIHAGAGGVGHLLIQIAKELGANVFATVGTAEKAEVASAMGADHVIVYSEVDFAEEVERLAGQRPLDIIYDGVGAATFAKGLGLLRPRGMMVTFGNASGPPDPVPPLDLMRHGSLFLTRPTLNDYIPTREELERRASDLFSHLERGLQVVIGTRVPMAEAAEAHRALESRSTTGKVLLEA